MVGPSPKPAFSPGTVVEVSSDEPGFRGSFYRATVVKPLPSSPDSYLVQYQTLVSDSSQPLREVAAASQLRPPPPPEKRRREFGMGDEVDVYHNDGWWAAVVTAELGGGVFELFFRGYKEQMVFGEKDFRVHRDWVDGVWVPPLDQDEEEEEEEEELNDKDQRTQIADVNGGDKETRLVRFEKGSVVEVSSDEEGFEGAWFAATIVEPLGNGGKFLVQYQSLMADDDGNLLREEIDILHMRPFPPENLEEVGRFKLFEEVDCLYNDGWWVGVVSEVLGKSRYKVYFKSSGEEMEFGQSDMRLHREWIDGKWVVASQVF